MCVKCAYTYTHAHTHLCAHREHWRGLTTHIVERRDGKMVIFDNSFYMQG
jgi:hypothetical protein